MSRLLVVVLAASLVPGCFVAGSRLEREVGVGFAGRPMSTDKLVLSEDPSITLATLGCGPVSFGTPPLALVLEFPQGAISRSPEHVVLKTPSARLSPEKIRFKPRGKLIEPRGDQFELWFRVTCADLNKATLEIEELAVNGVARKVPPVVFKYSEQTKYEVQRLEGQWYK